MRRIKSHTLEKLAYFRKYLEAYLVATKRMRQKYYIDALAGTGKCIFCDISECKSRGGERCIKCVGGKETDGSALIALKTKNCFSGYILIELEEKNFKELKAHIKKEINPKRVSKTKFLKGDANKILKKIHDHVPIVAGCLTFMDLEAAEIHWDTLEYISDFKKVEILILYPYDMSLVRLTKNYKAKLDKFYGTSDWFKLYKKGVTPEKRKMLLTKFYIENIKKLGFEYVEVKQIKTQIRGGKNLYHLILATHHPVGRKIIKNIFNTELDGQKKIKLFKD